MSNKLKNVFPVMFQKLDEMAGDERFTRVKLWLMHLGTNYNGSDFSKEVVESAFPTLGYIPIVGFIEKNSDGDDDFSDHRYILTKTNGKIEKQYIGQAYGTVLSPADNNAHFETRICDDGITREFVVVDGIIWNQFKDIANILNRDEVKNHSMELFEPSVKGFEDDDDIFHFTSFSFQAACILGNDYQAAMEGSTVEVQFTMNNFISDMQSEMMNKLNEYSEFIDKNKKGVVLEMPEKTIDTKKDAVVDFSMTVMEQFSEICNIVSSTQKVRDYWGDEVSRYYATDVQENEVIVVDRSENYNYYGFPFTVSGDKIEIDFKCGKRKKTQYVDFNDGSLNSDVEGAFSFAKELKDFEAKATEKINELQSQKDDAEVNYSTLKTDYDEIKPKYDDYAKKEIARVASETLAAKDSVFEKFDEHLSENPEYLKIKEQKADFSIDEIQGKCAVMFTEKSLNSNFSKKSKEDKPLSVDILGDVHDESCVVTKYGVIKINK